MCRPKVLSEAMEKFDFYGPISLLTSVAELFELCLVSVPCWTKPLCTNLFLGRFEPKEYVDIKQAFDRVYGFLIVGTSLTNKVFIYKAAIAR